MEGIEVHSFTGLLTGKFVNHVFPIRKSVNNRMDVFKNQLMTDIITDEKLDIEGKFLAYNFINRKMTQLYNKGVNNGTSFAEAYDFKHEVRKNLLKLTFRRV